MTEERHSRAFQAALITDEQEKAEAEARNGLRQVDHAMEVIHEALERGAFKLRPSLVLGLHRPALEGISAFAGNFRPAGVEIEGSRHAPPGAYLVPELVEDLCEYVNDKWETASPLHLAAYVMWRLNWIHPFDDGNGRTSRMLSFVVLCIKSKEVLDSKPTIFEQVVGNRTPYFHALDAADDAWKEGRVDVNRMEALLDQLLANQLHAVYSRVRGAANPSAPTRTAE